MGKNQNTFAKRQREMDKKRKQKDKRVRKEVRKNDPAGGEQAPEAAPPPDYQPPSV